MQEALKQEQDADREFHRDMIQRLLYNWKAMPDATITDEEYKNDSADAKQNNKYRLIWFHGIVAEVAMIVEAELISGSEEGKELLRRAKELSERAAEYRGKKVPEELVREGDTILEAVQEKLHT